ncbi:TPM domain-containing protein [Sphingomonas adhaesiva]|uniref:TPM domain-containing protein n=1 Tax=Sphingomonas adhaesiva TaxID=28212 RepID=UPI002FF6332C
MISRSLPALLLIALCAAPSAATPQPSIPLTGRVVDTAGILDTTTERDVADLSERLEHRTGHQFVVATVPTLAGQPIERYSLDLFNGWHIGRRCCNDGVGLLVAPHEHKVRIEVGTGLESTLTDKKTKAIIDNTILPAFRSGNLSLGVRRGAAAIVRELLPS